MIEEGLRHFLFITMRWLHIVCTTLLVGGTLFFEFVVPIAIEDFKNEHQMAIIGKARWVFKRVVWVAATLLVLSGSVTLYRMWDNYQLPGHKPAFHLGLTHVALAAVALLIAIRLIHTSIPPERPLRWLRINLAILLVVILAAVSSRHMRLSVDEPFLRQYLPGYLQSASETHPRSSAMPRTLPSSAPADTRPDSP